MIIVVMGVSGSGKSTIAKTLARKLRIEFVDADSFHSPENIAKMRAGTPLTDEDRQPWLQAMRTAIAEWIASDKHVALACSALKRNYRDTLNVDPQIVRFAYLKGSYRLFSSRLSRRQAHFMKESMLKSQFASLEEPHPNEATICDARKSVMEIVGLIISDNISPSDNKAAVAKARNGRLLPVTKTIGLAFEIPRKNRAKAERNGD